MNENTSNVLVVFFLISNPLILWPRTMSRTPERRDEEIDDLLSSMGADTQAKTAQSVERTKAKLNESLEVAEASCRALEQQNGQIRSINKDLERAKVKLGTSEKRFDEYERWRIFGGKSRKTADRAEKSFERVEQCSARESPAHKGELPKKSARVKGRARTEIAHGIEGRDDQEKEALKKVRDTDKEIDEGIRDISILLDQVEDRAIAMNEAVRTQNSDVQHLNDQVSDVNRGISRVNARVDHNLRRAGVTR